MKGMRMSTEKLGDKDVRRAAIVYVLTVLALVAVSVWIVSLFSE